MNNMIMKIRMIQWTFAAALTFCGASVFTSCTDAIGTVDNPTTKKGQLLEVYDVKGSTATARLTVDGKVLFTTSVAARRCTLSMKTV